MRMVKGYDYYYFTRVLLLLLKDTISFYRLTTKTLLLYLTSFTPNNTNKK